MAMYRKSVSTKHPEGESGLEQRWWRNPVIIAALVGALAVIIGAFIQRPDSKPKFSEPTTVEQHTYGSGSPGIGQSGGNVTIIQQQDGQKP
jgi:hypothetical protein